MLLIAPPPWVLKLCVMSVSNCCRTRIALISNRSRPCHPVDGIGVLPRSQIKIAPRHDARQGPSFVASTHDTTRSAIKWLTSGSWVEVTRGEPPELQRLFRCQAVIFAAASRLGAMGPWRVQGRPPGPCFRCPNANSSRSSTSTPAARVSSKTRPCRARWTDYDGSDLSPRLLDREATIDSQEAR